MTTLPIEQTPSGRKSRRRTIFLPQGEAVREQNTAALFRLPVYSILAFAWAVALATLHRDRGLLYRVTREDDVVEWATVMALLTLAVIVGKRLRATPGLPRPVWGFGWGLVALALAAVGEELSWGQRLFGFETGETMRQINLQHETNLHNLIPGELFNGLIVFALGIGFVLVPLVWRARSSSLPPWLPSQEVALLMLDAILINHYRFRSLPEQAGIVVLLALLAWQTVLALRAKKGPMIAACLAGWTTAACLYHSRAVLKVANHQYEIRELLIVVLAAVWADQTLQSYQRSLAPNGRDSR